VIDDAGEVGVLVTDGEEVPAIAVLTIKGNARKSSSVGGAVTFRFPAMPY
jgi:hypothetical protein